jgi:MFS family permease
MKINHVIRTLVTADFFVSSGFAVFAPIFAVFVTQQIKGGAIEVVGFGAAIAQVFKVGFQIPVAQYLDRNHGEYDDFISMIIGTAISVLVPFLYFFASTAFHIYLIQALYGIGLALAVPPWFAIFTRHIDKMQENFEWSLESVAIGISGAISAALGGIIAQQFGFRPVFIIGGLLALIGGSFQLSIFRDLKRKVARGMVQPQPDRSV